MNKSSSPDVLLRVDAERRHDEYQQVYRQESPRSKKWFPWLVPIIVVANTIMFIITMYVNNCPGNSNSCVASFLGRFSFQPTKENRLLGPTASTLLKMGGLKVSNIVDGNQGWRLVTCIWLHGGILHILVNMVCLLFIGIKLEQEFGFLKIGALYMISGIGGSLISALFLAKSTVSVGASGALFGLLGAILSELLTNWTTYASKFATLAVLLSVIALNLGMGLLPYIDNYAHIGGFISGFLVGFVLLIRPQHRWMIRERRRNGGPVNKHKKYQYALWIIAVILLTIGFIVGFVLLFRGYNGNDHCSWCKYLNCIPSSRWNCDQTYAAKCIIATNGAQTNITCEGTENTRSFSSAADLNDETIKSFCIQLCT